MDVAESIQSRVNHHKRTLAKAAERFACPYCERNIFASDEDLWRHVSRQHSDSLQDLGIHNGTPLFRKLLRDEALHKAELLAEKARKSTSSASGSPLELSRLSISSEQKKSSPPRQTEPPHNARGGKRRAGSDLRYEHHRYSNPRRAEPRVQVQGDEYDGYYPDMSSPHIPNQSRPKPMNPHLWDPHTPASLPHMAPAPSSPAQRRPAKTHRPSSTRRSGPAETSSGAPQSVHAVSTDPRWPDILLQPDSRPISQEQLAAEVKSIYAGLTMVETKCIHVDKAHATTAQDPNSKAEAHLAPDHWQALIALHRTLLHEHHDFFLASQHPSASPALQKLAAKYSMPARMWKHGIHSFLELLRHRLPESLDYMLAFIYLAYQMMALLYETVPTFEDTWIECLGDLGRYRMAIEDEDIRDRETWAGVARFWYSKAADKAPPVGRLYHHLAILARPNALQQVYYYSRSLTVEQPFMSARESILTLFEPALDRSHTFHTHASPLDTLYIRAIAMLFKRSQLEAFDAVKNELLTHLDNHIGRVTAKWKEQGAYVAITNIGALFDYGSLHSTLRRLFVEHARRVRRGREATPSASEDDGKMPPSPGTPQKSEHGGNEDLPLTDLKSDFPFSLASSLVFSIFQLVLQRIGDKNVLPHVHILLTFLFSLAKIPYDTYDSAFVLNAVPWEDLVIFLNTLVKSEKLDVYVEDPDFMRNKQKEQVPLPEDYLVRGAVWGYDYFPAGWFDSAQDEEERSLELPSTVKSRTDRVMWLGICLASFNRWIQYSETTKTWSLSPSFQATKEARMDIEKSGHAEESL